MPSSYEFKKKKKKNNNNNKELSHTMPKNL